MTTPEETELNYKVEKNEERSVTGFLQCLDDFLAAADDGRGYSVEREHDRRFNPLEFSSDIFLYPNNMELLRRVRRVYNDPSQTIAADHLRRFLISRSKREKNCLRLPSSITSPCRGSTTNGGGIGPASEVTSFLEM